MAARPVPGLRFTAIDFETADRRRSSACAVGLVVVEDGAIIDRRFDLIRPPESDFRFAYLHHISADQVAGACSFGEVWAGLAALIENAHFLAAHHASFDRAVLRVCCQRAGLKPPHREFICSADLARRVFGLRSARLPDVCARLGIRLQHHDPLSDAEACARIILAGKPVLLHDSLSGRSIVRFSDGQAVRVRSALRRDAP